MLAYHNDSLIKAKLIAALEDHNAHDRLVKGQYWQNGKGCAIACTLHSFGEKNTANHSAYERLFGIPQVIARLEDLFFERLENRASRSWPLRFSNAIRPGADLTMIWPKFAVWLLTDELPRSFDKKKYSNIWGAIDKIADLYREHIETGNPIHKTAAYAATDAADAAYAAAYAADAAAAAADAAASAAAAAAAASAADAAYAAYAAYAAAHTADAAAHTADAASITRQSDKLIELLEAA